MTQTTISADLLMSPAAEAAVLGSMIIDPTVIPAVLGLLTTESFALAEHQAIFSAILSLYRSNPGGELDGLLVRGELASSKVFNEAGGAEYLRRVVESVPTSANALYYAKQVADRQRRREATSAVEQMWKSLAEDGSTDDVITQIQGLALGLENRSREQHVYHVRDHAKDFAVETQDLPHVVHTGFEPVDRLVGGVSPGAVAIVAARPSIGKTAFACGWALNAARADHAVALFTLEMSPRSLMERLSATLGQISLSEVKGRNPSQTTLNAFYGGSIELSELPIRIIENTPTVERMTAVLRQLKQAGPVDLVVIDYVGLMSATESRNRSRNEQISEISRGLKLMAQAEHVPVVVLSQLNRECEGRDNHRPRMSDLRDSGSLEQDADAVLLLHREDYYRRMADPQATEIDGEAEVIVAKNRNGPTGLARLGFVEEYMRFTKMALEFCK